MILRIFLCFIYWVFLWLAKFRRELVSRFIHSLLIQFSVNSNCNWVLSDFNSQSTNSRSTIVLLLFLLLLRRIVRQLTQKIQMYLLDTAQAASHARDDVQLSKLQKISVHLPDEPFQQALSTVAVSVSAAIFVSVAVSVSQFSLRGGLEVKRAFTSLMQCSSFAAGPERETD